MKKSYWCVRRFRCEVLRRWQYTNEYFYWHYHIYIYLLYKKDLINIQTLFCILTICRKVKMRSNASKNRTKLQYICILILKTPQEGLAYKLFPRTYLSCLIENDNKWIYEKDNKIIKFPLFKRKKEGLWLYKIKHKINQNIL